MSWASLPTEITVLILNNLIDSKCRQYEDPDVRRRRREFLTGNSQAVYASVCREWNTFFEVANFQKLILHQSDIETFGKLVLGRPRASFVRWIWVRIELPTYDCTKCDKSESVEEDKANKFLFTEAIWTLFDILSKFHRSHPGITLELSADSPSLTHHYAHELGWMANDTAWHTNNAARPVLGIVDEAHYWRDGKRQRPLKSGAALRMTGHPQGLRFDRREPTARHMRDLPKVGVVKALVIRLQCYRHFSITKALDPIIRNLTQLRDLSYECYKGFNIEQVNGHLIRHKENDILLRDTFQSRRTLRKVSIFEATSRCNYLTNDARWTFRTRPWSSLGIDLGKTSKHFEELYINDMVDAKDFFQPFWEGAPNYQRTRREWKNLKRLSLYSSLLRPQNYDQQIIVAAARAARKMPQLQFMELWSCDRRWACIFTYTTSENLHDPHKIELRSSWAGQLSEEAVKAWRDVVQQRGTGTGLEANVNGFGERLRHSVGRDVMCALALKGELLTDTSRKQIIGQHPHTVRAFQHL